MLEIEYFEDSRTVQLHLVDPIELPVKLFEVKQLLHNSDYKNFHLLEERLMQISSPEWVPDSQPIIIAEARDAYIEIEVSGDGMEAIAKFFPSQGGDELTQKKIIDTLRENIVYKGIRQRVITELIEQKTGNSSYLIATGKMPEDGAAACFEYLVTPIQQRQLVPQMREDGTMDMHDLGDIGTVEEQQPLMRKLPSTAGENGYTVSGEVVFSNPLEDIPIAVGEGTVLSSKDVNLLLASRKGVPVEIENGIKVDDILMVNKNADLSIGNIDYHGSVIITGDVKEGMVIKAKGDLTVNGFVEPAHLEAVGNITIGQGVIGNHKEEPGNSLGRESYSTTVVAGATVSARFAQHAFLKGVDVQLSTQLLHCLVEADNNIQVGGEGQKNAKLVGGYLNAKNQISAGVMGAPSQTKTILDFSEPFNDLSNKIKEVLDTKKKKLHFSESIEKAKDQLSALPASVERDEKLKKVDASEQALQKEIVFLEAELESLKKKRQLLKREVSVKVFDKLYPGVEIRLADEVDVVREEHRAGTFRFEDDILIFDR